MLKQGLAIASANVLIASAIGLMPSTSSAAAIVVNSNKSANLLSTTGGGNDLGTIANYNNTGGSYMLLVLNAGSGSNSSNSAMSLPSLANVDVTFGSQAFTLVNSVNADQKTFHTSVWLLKDPNPITADVTIDFGANIASGLLGSDPNGVFNTAWRFGVISLTNVNETAGANGDGVIVIQNIGTTGTTLTHPSLNADDFVLMTETAINGVGNPNYITATGIDPVGSTVPFYDSTGASGTGSREYDVSYAELVAGDFSAPNTVIISSNGTTRTSAARFAVVVEGVVPEPASLALLGLAGLALRRRR